MIKIFKRNLQKEPKLEITEVILLTTAMKSIMVAFDATAGYLPSSPTIISQLLRFPNYKIFIRFAFSDFFIHSLLFS